MKRKRPRVRDNDHQNRESRRTYSLKRRGEAGCGSPSAAQQLAGGWSGHTRPLLGGKCRTRLLSAPCGGGAWLGGGPLPAGPSGCWR